MTALASDEGPFLHAWADPVAGVKTFTACVRLVDLAGDGDHRLVIADQEKRIKVYKSTSVASVHPLLDVPVALVAFYPADTAAMPGPRVPSIAVAAGSFVFVYRNLRPFMKFTLPQVPVSKQETGLWEEYWANRLPLLSLIEGLKGLRDSGVVLTSRAGDVLALGDDREVNAYLQGVKGRPLVQQTVVTCMEAINREREGEKEISSVVLGTEAKQLLFLDANCSAIETAITLPSVPTHIAVTGLLAVDHRIHVACRDGVVYTIRNKQLVNPMSPAGAAATIECGALPVGIVRTDQHLWIGTVDAQLFCYHAATGKKVWSTPTPLPSGITAMERMCVRKAEVSDCCCVALEGGAVRVFNGRSCVAALSLPDTATALRFGQYSREMNSLALIGRSGYLHIKMTKRTASFRDPLSASVLGGAASAGAGGGSSAARLSIPEQEIPLPIPKKTRVYLENTQREKEHSLEIHRAFQRDLTKLRLTTARAFVKTIADGGSALATMTGASLRLNASVSGLGPNFKIRLELSNVGNSPAMEVQVVFAYRLDRYLMPQSTAKLPLMVPGNRYTLEFPCICVDPAGAADSVRCVVLRGGSRSASSIVPSINAVIKMPLSQPLIPV